MPRRATEEAVVLYRYAILARSLAGARNPCACRKNERSSRERAFRLFLLLDSRSTTIAIVAAVIREHREHRLCASRLASCSLNRRVHANRLRDGVHRGSKRISVIRVSIVIIFLRCNGCAELSVHQRTAQSRKSLLSTRWSRLNYSPGVSRSLATCPIISFATTRELKRPSSSERSAERLFLAIIAA